MSAGLGAGGKPGGKRQGTEPSGDRLRSWRMRRWLAVFVLAAGCSSGSGGKAATTSSSSSSSERTESVPVFNASGRVETTTDDFDVTGKWTIHIEGTIPDRYVAVEIRNTENDRLFERFEVKGSQDTALRGSGTYYLKVTPYDTDYRIVVSDDPG